MRQALLLLGLLLLPSMASARPRHFYTNWKWWAGEAVIAGAMFADAGTTCAGYSHGAVENHFPLRGNHSCGKTVAWMSVGVGVETSFHLLSYKFLHDDPSPVWRNVGFVTVPAIVAVGSGTAIEHNLDVLGQSK